MFNILNKMNKEAILNETSSKKLVNDELGSYNYDKARNIFIEGDNLEALRLIRQVYDKKIKLIYLDPPYNTGNEFIYDDSKKGGGYCEYKLSRNSFYKNIGERHQKWIQMMYPRLLISRELLREDGVIVVSIDDNEMFELRFLLNEIMGEENFLGVLVWRRKNYDYEKVTGIETQHEYIVLYKKGSAYKDKYLKPISSWIEYGIDNYIIDKKNHYELKCCYQDKCKKDIDDLFEKDMKINYPKSVMQMKLLIDLFCQKDDFVLDLFAGSGTLGQAIIEYNKEKNFDIAFVLIQMAKPTTKGNFNKISDIAFERCILTYQKMKYDENKCWGIRRMLIE